jgi:hypothetical protein
MTLPVAIESALVSASEWTALNAIATELSDTFAKKQIFRTETEARVSVLDDIRRPTAASKYWQAVREQAVMLEQLALLSFEYRRNEVKVLRHSERLSQATTPLDAADAQIDLDEAVFNRVSMTITASDRVRELLMWSKLKAELDDGSFDTQSCETHQLVSYTARFASRAAIMKPEHMSGDEFSNLAGQLQTSLKRCREVGAINELRAALPSAISQQLGIEG